MSQTDPVTAADVRAFAVRVVAANITRSAAEQAEYERLRAKLFAAAGGDPGGIDRIAAVTRAAKACLVPGRGGDDRTLVRLRTAITTLINYFA